MMKYDNDAKQLKYRVLSSVARLSYENQLSDHMGEIPYEIIPVRSLRFAAAFIASAKSSANALSAACGDDLPRQAEKAVIRCASRSVRGMSDQPFQCNG